MIFYFSATGNSLWVARELKKKLNEEVISINQLLQSGIDTYEFTLTPAERIGFVFPVHSWGPPTLLLRFIKRLKLNDYVNQQIFAVATCGDDAGYMKDVLAKYLEKKNLHLESCHTIRMPNTYILFPFFDVDSPKVEKEKLSDAVQTLEKISKAIIERRQDNSLYHKGFGARLKTNQIYPLFSKYTYGKSKFYFTEACIHCGRCRKVCPNRNIILENDDPVWLEHCVQCLACIHRCPVRAIEYGKKTIKKGRYHHPALKGDEI